MDHKPSQSGQIGVIILLLAVVVLTVGLSLAARTTSQADLTAQQQDASRVFYSAENGIADRLNDSVEHEKDGTPLPNTVNSTDLTNLTSQESSITQSSILDTKLSEGATADLKLNGTAGNVSIQWSKVACNQDHASLLVSVYSATAAKHFAVKGFGLGCTDNPDISFIESLLGDEPYFFSYTVPVTASDVLLRVMPLYADTDIQISGTAIAGAQYVSVSKAKSSSEESTNQEAFSLQVVRTLSSVPSFMNFALVSGQSIVK